MIRLLWANIAPLQVHQRQERKLPYCRIPSFQLIAYLVPLQDLYLID